MERKMSKLLEKYKSLSRSVKASLWFVVSNIMLKGISFITLPLFSRILTTEEYGMVSVYQSWVSLVAIITTLTIWGGVFNVSMAKFPERQATIVSSFQGLALTITGAFMAVSCLFIQTEEKLFGMPFFLVICMFVEIAVQIPFNLWAAQERYNYDYQRLISVTVITTILNPILGYAAIIACPGARAEARIVSNLLIQVVVGVFFGIINQHKGKHFFDRRLWHYALTFNVVLIPHYLSMQVLSQSDRIMISDICGSGDAGIYSVAYNFALLLNLFTNGVNSSLTPHIYKALKEEKKGKLAKQTTGVVLLIALLAIAMICFMPDLFYLMLPESYYPALTVIPPVTASAFFMFLYPLFGSVEFYYERKQYVTISSILGAVLNVVLNYIFIRLTGFVAAAYTTLFCYVMFAVFHYFFMKKILREEQVQEQIYDSKSILIISIGVIAFSELMVPLYKWRFARWCIIALTMILGIIKRKWIIGILGFFREKED